MLSAILMPVLIGIAVLMVDVAIAYSAKSRIEHVVDEAADAAVVKLPDTAAAHTFAESLAEDLLATVGLYSDNQAINVTVEHNSVTVEVTVDTPTFFAGIFGTSGLTSSASATRTDGP